MSADSSPKKQRNQQNSPEQQKTIWDIVSDLVNSIGSKNLSLSLREFFQRPYLRDRQHEVEPEFIAPPESPCIGCPTACWQVHSEYTEIDPKLVEEIRLDYKNKVTYYMECFCLAKHCVLESYPVACSGNPEFKPN